MNLGKLSQSAKYCFRGQVFFSSNSSYKICLNGCSHIDHDVKTVFSLC